MKLLILTQKVDRDDDVLGFMHGWLTAFSKVFSEISVVALGVGKYDLPSNVKILSLGKEKGGSRYRKTLRYIVMFYAYMWKERKNYDAVLVHMNTEYVLLGGLYWLFARKSLYLWYNHRYASFASRLAFLFPKRLFHTSPFAAPARFKKAVRMPVGVDTELFHRLSGITPEPNSILFLGRLSPVKKFDILLDALAILSERKVPFSLHVYGAAPDRDITYATTVRKRAEKELDSRVTFHGPVSNIETPKLYNAHSVYVNLTAAGSFDKTIVEAMACETATIISNESLRDEVPDTRIVRQDDAKDLARVLEEVLAGTTEYREAGKELRAYALKRHALSVLAEELKRMMSAIL